MALFADVRDGLEATLNAGLSDGVNVYRLPTDRVEAPAVVVMGFRMDPETLGATLRRVRTDLLVVVSRRHVDQVELLDALLDPSVDGSVLDVLAADPSLGGKVDSAIVTSVGDYGEIIVGDVGYYSATVSLEVLG